MAGGGAPRPGKGLMERAFGGRAPAERRVGGPAREGGGHVCDPLACGISYDEGCPAWARPDYPPGSPEWRRSCTPEQRSRYEAERRALETLLGYPKNWRAALAGWLLQNLPSSSWLALARRLRPFLLQVHGECGNARKGADHVPA